MGPIELIALLVAGGLVLLLAELLLPTHGVLGVVGLLLLGAAIIVVFGINKWLGLGVFLAAIVASPFVAQLAMKLWERSPIGKKIILQQEQSIRPLCPITLGQQGVAVTELRPIGECDFGDQRLEAASELGIIHAGQRVKVIGLDQGRPTVRAVEA